MVDSLIRILVCLSVNDPVSGAMLDLAKLVPDPRKSGMENNLSSMILRFSIDLLTRSNSHCGGHISPTSSSPMSPRLL